MPTRINRTLRWIGQPTHAISLLVGFAALLVIALIFAVSGWQTARSNAVQLDEVEAARIADKRAQVRTAYAICVTGVPNARRVNAILSGIRQDYMERAESSRALAMLDSVGSPERKLRLASARRLEARAKRIFRFPVRSKEECRDTRDAALAAIGEVN